MAEESHVEGPFDTVDDWYGKAPGTGSDQMISALQAWDEAQYVPLRVSDPELYELIVNQLGVPIEILLGNGTVKLGLRHRYVELTWNGDEEDLLDLVLEGAELLSGL
ncbi:MAG TPA: hypothetical protein VHJ78_04075 [Actinomycetota bacterium]|nr:hypothetical protein [Actinomycetota bacterium]